MISHIHPVRPENQSVTGNASSLSAAHNGDAVEELYAYGLMSSL